MRAPVILCLALLMHPVVQAQEEPTLDEKWDLTVAFEDSGAASGIQPDKNLLLFRSTCAESSVDHLVQQRLQRELLNAGWRIFNNSGKEADAEAINAVYKSFSDPSGMINGCSLTEALVVRLTASSKKVTVEAMSPFKGTTLFKIATPSDPELIAYWQANKESSETSHGSILGNDWMTKMRYGFTRKNVVYLKGELGYTFGGLNQPGSEVETYKYLTGCIDYAPVGYRDGLSVAMYYTSSLVEPQTGVESEYDLAFRSYGARLAYHTGIGVGLGMQLGRATNTRSIADGSIGIPVNVLGRPALEEYLDTRMIVSYAIGKGALSFQCFGSVSFIRYVSASFGACVALSPNTKGHERLPWVK